MSDHVQVSSPSFVAAPGASKYLIYTITRRSDGRSYVGVTRRSLVARVVAHRFDALRDRARSPRSLGYAIREAYFEGVKFADAFEAAVLEDELPEREARAAEARWIEQLATAYPSGFNVMPGGRSLGGPANSQPIEVNHPLHGRLSFASVGLAIDYRNRELVSGGEPTLLASTIYLRMAQEWSPDEALGYIRHADRRGERPAAFVHQGMMGNRLRDVAAISNIPTATLRSRLHRAAVAGVARYDLAHDRRHTPTTTRRAIRLPDPRDPGSERALDARAFARAAGVPKSTVLHRYTLLQRGGRDPDRMPAEALLRYLRAPQDRRQLITLKLVDGRSLTGGVRDVIRQMLADTELAAARPERLGESAIRRRIRLLKSVGPIPNAILLWAFGFGPKNRAVI